MIIKHAYWKPLSTQRHTKLYKQQGCCDIECNTIASKKPPVSIAVVVKCLKHDDDEGHDWFHEAELECCLLTEPQEANSVCLPHQAASSIHAIRPKIKQHIKIILKFCYNLWQILDC